LFAHGHGGNGTHRSRAGAQGVRPSRPPERRRAQGAMRAHRRGVVANDRGILVNGGQPGESEALAGAEISV
jgi:hypothetical protein